MIVQSAWAINVWGGELLTTGRCDELHVIRVSVDEPLDDVNLLQENGHQVLELRRAANKG